MEQLGTTFIIIQLLKILFSNKFTYLYYMKLNLAVSFKVKKIYLKVKIKHNSQ